MNDIERRTLIGAAGLGAIAALSKAGPLNPPAGAVAGTGRTTDEIYNKIPATFPPVGGYDGRIPIPGGAAGVTINTPGSYVLTGNLLTIGNAITVTVAGVSLDLNGYRVSSSSTTSQVITATATPRLVIRNGSVTGGQSGVVVTGISPGVIIENLVVAGPRQNGIFIFGSASPGCVVRACSVLDAGVTSLSSDLFIVTGIGTGSSIGCRVDSCCVVNTVHNNTAAGGNAYGIDSFGTGSQVSYCVVTNTVGAPNSIGIRMAAATVYRDNTVTNFPTEYSSGTNGGGNF